MLIHKDLLFKEQMKAQLEAVEACRRSLPGGLEAVASARENICRHSLSAWGIRNSCEPEKHSAHRIQDEQQPANV